MSIKRQFDLSYFPNGDENLLLDGAPIVPNSLVLFVTTIENDMPSQMFPLCYVPEDLEADTISFYKEYTHAEVFQVIFGFSTTTNALYFEYIPSDISSSVLYVDDSATSFIHSLISSNGVGSETPLNGVLFESLNGADGSYADGTPVTVVGRDGAFKVLASRNFYNDSKDSQNMLIYFLERTDLTHKPTMLVADIYVKKVVTP